MQALPSDLQVANGTLPKSANAEDVDTPDAWAGVPVAYNEEKRLAVLHSLQILDRKPDDALNAITSLLAGIYEVIC